jgi:hypothetical protein
MTHHTTQPAIATRGRKSQALVNKSSFAGDLPIAGEFSLPLRG